MNEVPHIQTVSPKCLMIADSQAKKLFFPNFNVLSLPGGIIQHAYNFVPPTYRYEIIALSFGGNDLFDNDKTSTASTQEIANQLLELANHLLTRAKEV